MEKWTVVSSEWWGASFRSIFWPAAHKGKSVLSAEPQLCEKPFDLVPDAAEPPMDLHLHSELAGVKGVEDALQPYEADVGIRVQARAGDEEEPLLIFDRSLDEEDVVLARQQWEEQVESLLGGVLSFSLSKPLCEVVESEPESPLWDLNGLESPLLKSIVPRRSLSPGLTDSELSVDSDPMPSTPRASKKSYAHVLFGGRSVSSSPDEQHPQVVSPMPSKPLNASALSFTPMSSTPLGFNHPPETPPPTNSSDDSPFTSPTYEFDFPSLNSNPTASPSARKTAEPLPRLQKDENGFYIPVVTPLASTRTSTPRRPAAALLPAFLAERSSPARARNTSKTREIVDRLRSSHRSRRADASRRQSTAGSDKAAGGEAFSPNADAQAATEDIDGWISSVVHDERAGESIVSEDGWIECSPAPPRAPRQRRSASRTPPSSTSTVFPSPSPSATSFGMPCTPQQPSFFTPPFPQPNPAMMQAAYVQMQMQMQHAQAQAQAQWQAQMHPTTAAAFGGPVGFFSPYAYGAPPPFPPPPHAAGPVLYDAKGKMGNAGIHALW